MRHAAHDRVRRACPQDPLGLATLTLRRWETPRRGDRPDPRFPRRRPRPGRAGPGGIRGRRKRRAVYGLAEVLASCAAKGSLSSRRWASWSSARRRPGPAATGAGSPCWRWPATGAARSRQHPGSASWRSASWAAASTGCPRSWRRATRASRRCATPAIRPATSLTSSGSCRCSRRRSSCSASSGAGCSRARCGRPADIEFAARKGSQRALESAVDGDGQPQPEPGGPTTADYVAALAETRPTLTTGIVDEFTEDIATLARL
jgi:hypothetical protein